MAHGLALCERRLIEGLGPLHLTLYATKVLLYRALMHPATKAAKGILDSNLRTWFPHALSDFAQFTEFFVSINPGDLRGFWGRRKSTISLSRVMLS